MSKEEMVQGIWEDVEWGHPEIAVEKLDTYASEIAVGLLEWVRANGIYPGGEMWNFRREYITTPQLFQQFLTNKNEKK